VTRRIRINLLVFGLLAAVLSVWAVRNVLGFDPFSRPYRITAQFARSPGLQPGFDVTYLGVAVGEIRSVRLKGTMVVADLSIGKGKRIPRGATASAALKSAIGEPYVDLSPPRGQVGGAPMRPGDVIPLSRTTVAESYGDLFADVTKTINGLSPENLRIITRELAKGLDGRGGTLVSTVDGASQLAHTFASNTQTLDSLIGNLGVLTGTLAAKRGDLGAGISGTASITSSLAEVDDSLARIRDTAPGLLDSAAGLLSESERAARCALSALGVGLPTLLSRSNVADLETGLQWSPQLAKAMLGAITFVDGKPNLNLKFILTLGPEKTPVEYKNLQPLPDIPRIPTCPGITLPKQQIPPLKKSDEQAGSGSDTGTTSAATGTPVRNTSSTSRHGVTPWLIYLPPLIAGLILLRVFMSAAGAAWRPTWRRRNR
jgi:phospholipid/cholesterol/gamma-HCH transport system substrate-binding protein